MVSFDPTPPGRPTVARVCLLSLAVVTWVTPACGQVDAIAEAAAETGASLFQQWTVAGMALLAAAGAVMLTIWITKQARKDQPAWAAPPGSAPAHGNGHKPNGEFARIEGMLNTIAATTRGIDGKVDKMGADLAKHIDDDDREHGRQRDGVDKLWNQGVAPVRESVGDVDKRVVRLEAITEGHAIEIAGMARRRART